MKAGCRNAAEQRSSISSREEAVCLFPSYSVIPCADRFHDTDGDPILAEFFVKFQQQADALSVRADALYNALLADAELQPPNWDLQGRQANIWKTLGESCVIGRCIRLSHRD